MTIIPSRGARFLRRLRHNISVIRGIAYRLRHDIWLLACNLTAISRNFVFFDTFLDTTFVYDIEFLDTNAFYGEYGDLGP